MNIKTDRESVAALVAELIGDSASCRELGDRLQLAADTLTALLAERDAALAEGASLKDALQEASVEADHYKGEIKLRNRIPAMSDLPANLLRRAEAAEAEVARLSTPPDDAEVAALVAEVRKLAWSGRDDTADALTRLSQALAVKREAIEVKGGNEHAPTQWAYDRACDALRATKAELAKHGSKT